MTEIKYKISGGYVDREIYTDNEANQPALDKQFKPYRILKVYYNDGQLLNDGTETVTVTVNVVSGLDVSRGDSPTVLDYDGQVTLSVDGQQTTKTLTKGSVEFDLTTDKPAGSEIEIVAESLADHPAESDSATIEVVSQ